MNNLIKTWLLGLNRVSKNFLVLATDYLMLILAFLVSLSIRINEFYIPNEKTILLIFLAPLIALPIFLSFGLYKTLFRYAGYINLLWIMAAISVYTLLWFVVVLFTGIVDRPYDFLFINWLVSTFLVSSIRYLARWFLVIKDNELTNAVIYGAGSAGLQVRNALWNSNEIKIIAFIDDDLKIQGKYIDGLKVRPASDLKRLKEKKNVSEIIFAIPSLQRRETQKKYQSLKHLSLLIRVLPSVQDIAKGRISISDLRKVNIEDLLKREIRKPIDELMKKNIHSKSILVTGAGGSIGSELCREIIFQKPESLTIFDISEYALYKLEQEIESFDQNIKLNAVIGDVRDYDHLKRLMTDYNIDTIYHAAAYKHVPLVEKNIISGIDVNVFGTHSCIKSAIDSNVRNFVFISTDKAVRPTNVMGASKRFAEIILQALAKSNENNIDNATKISMVRFGNVLGSSGSVVPLFNQQIKRGGPVTVTDPNIIRYFMTLKEAAQLVIQAGALAEMGEIFLLDMGEPVEVMSLAEDMIKLSGMTVRNKNNPVGDIEIVFTGLRPGEKLFEELLIDVSSHKTQHPKILRGEESSMDLIKVESYLRKIEEAKEEGDSDKILMLLEDSIDGYKRFKG